MSQGTYLIVVTFVAFLVFITARNELLTYLDLIVPGRGPGDATGAPTPSGTAAPSGTTAPAGATTAPTNLPNSTPYADPNSLPSLFFEGTNGATG